MLGQPEHENPETDGPGFPGFPSYPAGSPGTAPEDPGEPVPLVTYSEMAVTEETQLLSHVFSVRRGKAVCWVELVNEVIGF